MHLRRTLGTMRFMSPLNLSAAFGRLSPVRILLLFLAFFAGALAIGVLLLVFSPRARVQTVQTTLNVLGADLPKDDNGHTNILLLGTGDKNHDGADLTDTMIIASIDPASTQSVVMISLPRDLFLDANKRLTNGRINAVYANEKYRLERSGLSDDVASLQALSAVGEEIGEKAGVEIHGVIKVDFTAFENVVDALGGVDIVVEKTINDYTYPISETQVGLFRLEEGPQHLDGKTALRYARSRHSTNDFDRSARQQQLLKAIADKIRNLGRLEQIRFLSDLNESLAGHVQTTMTRDQMLGMAQIASELSLDRAITTQLNFNAGSDYSEARAGGFVYPAPPELFEGASILLPTSLPGGSPDWRQIRTYVQFLTLHRAAYLAEPDILIQDLGAARLQAHRLRNELLRYRWTVLELEQPEVEEAAETSSVYYRDNAHYESASFLGRVLSLPVARATETTGSGDVLIQLGSDFTHKPFATMSGAVLGN
jgi:LCP family protein required for cell wall assembly